MKVTQYLTLKNSESRRESGCEHHPSSCCWSLCRIGEMISLKTPITVYQPWPKTHQWPQEAYKANLSTNYLSVLRPKT